VKQKAPAPSHLSCCYLPVRDKGHHSPSHTPFAPTRFWDSVGRALRAACPALASQPQHSTDRCGDPTAPQCVRSPQGFANISSRGHVGTAGRWHAEGTARGRGAQSERSTATTNSQPMARAPFQPALPPSTAPSPQPRQASTPGLPRRSYQNRRRRPWIRVIRTERAADRTNEMASWAADQTVTRRAKPIFPPGHVAWNVRTHEVMPAEPTGTDGNAR
jgi:hypothetical protein